MRDLIGLADEKFVFEAMPGEDCAGECDISSGDDSDAKRHRIRMALISATVAASFFLIIFTSVYCKFRTAPDGGGITVENVTVTTASETSANESSEEITRNELITETENPVSTVYQSTAFTGTDAAKTETEKITAGQYQQVTEIRTEVTEQAAETSDSVIVKEPAVTSPAAELSVITESTSAEPGAEPSVITEPTSAGPGDLTLVSCDGSYGFGEFKGNKYILSGFAESIPDSLIQDMIQVNMRVSESDDTAQIYPETAAVAEGFDREKIFILKCSIFGGWHIYTNTDLSEEERTVLAGMMKDLTDTR